jgi:hypothetical protein
VTVTSDTTVAGAKAGIFEDFMDALVRPRTLFERNRNTSFVRPALVQSIFLLILGVAAMNLIAPYFEAEMLRAMRQQAAAGGPTPEGAAGMAGTMSKVTAVVGFALAPWMVGLLGGLATWVGARIVGAKLTFGQSAMISAWSYTPALIGALAMAVQGALTDPSAIRGASDAQLGPARFMDPNTTPPVTLALMQQLDLFNLWGLVLVAIGVAVVARKDMGSGALAAVIRFALFALATIIPALLR